MTIKTILVPAAGSESDYSVFETALAAARPLVGHIHFYHIVVGPGEAATNTPHAGFAMGAGLVSSLHQLRAEEQTRLLCARDHAERFCKEHRIPMLDEPLAGNETWASWYEESGDSVPLIIRRARYSDLVVMGRQRHSDHLPENLLKRLLLESGRPILVATSSKSQTLTGTIMICWKECSQAAHAVTAAMPLLRQAARVLIVSVSETDDDRALAAADGLARQMRWHGIHATPRHLASDGHAVADVLSAVAQDCKVDLMVMGGYSRRGIRELIFGGCTETFLQAAECPILLVH